LSAESARAVKNVRTIIQSFPDHGVVDVFKEYPARDVIFSILALSKLQRAVAHYDKLEQEAAAAAAAVINKQKTTTSSSTHRIPQQLLFELAHYSIYANAAYGWTLDLAFKRKFHRNDLQTLIQSTGVQEEDIIATEWSAKTLRPAYFIVRDRDLQTIVLCVRGTLSTRDILTDLCCTAESFTVAGDDDDGGDVGDAGVDSTDHQAHQGMLHSALFVSEAAKSIVRKALADNPGYSLVLVGHSLGSGVAAVLGTLWEEDFPDLKVYGYGSPCVGPLGSKPTESRNVYSVIAEGDPFGALSLGHVADVSNAIAALCEDEEMRSMIMMKTDGALETLERDDLIWCEETLGIIRKRMVAEKMYPPGRIFYMRRRKRREEDGYDDDRDTVISIEESRADKFGELILHPSMLDVSRHVPSMYESMLQELWLSDIR